MNETPKNEQQKITDRNTVRAFWISIGTGVVMLAIVAYFLITNSGTEVTGPTDVRITVALIGLSGFISAWIVRKTKSVSGMSLILIMWYLATVITALNIKDIGLTVSLVILTATFGLTSTILSSTRVARVLNILAVIISVFVILLDIIQPFPRAVNTTPLASWGLAVLLVVGYGVLLVFNFSKYTLRTKLIITLLAAALIPLAIITLFNASSGRTILTETIGNNISTLSTSQALQVGQTLQNELNQLNMLANTSVVQQRAEAGTAANTLSSAEINALDQEWRSADAANNNSDPLVSSVLNDSLSAELLKFQANSPENVEVFLTDLPGVSLATTGRTSDYLQSDEDWWQSTYKNGLYIGQPEFDASSKTLAINMAVAVRAHDSNRIVGVFAFHCEYHPFCECAECRLVWTVRPDRESIYPMDKRSNWFQTVLENMDSPRKKQISTSIRLRSRPANTR